MVLAIIITFIVGYLAIALEHTIKVNKAASALVTGVVCWTFYILSQDDKEAVSAQLVSHMGDIAGILFFLMGAMTIVEVIDAYNGFEVITSRITTRSKKKLLWIIGILAFLLSAFLDNLTTTIVVVSLLRKLINDKDQRLIFVGVTIIAANAGGAWSPLGDVTTTMLWIGKQISASQIVIGLFLPSIVCLAVPLFILSTGMKGQLEPVDSHATSSTQASTTKERNVVFALGVSILLFVPVFKSVTHLPPFMAILLGLGLIWIILEIINNGVEAANKTSVTYVLRRIDTPSILFFLGILVSVAALDATGQLARLSQWLTQTVSNHTVIVTATGLLSAIVDNVPLVAASQSMYSLEQFPTDHFFWEFLAYATGTGGSALIIGSAAGVAAMGLENINFFWYLRKISGLALIGYFSGAVVYLVQYTLTH